MLSVKALSLHLSSDSLLRFVYGPDGDFPFVQFGDASYLYTNDKARIDAFVMDSTRGRDRPITFTFVHEHDLWLLKRFEPTPGSRIGDSI
ncbi:MAG: hypothetical protein D6800_12550 [Candidatus Zixiibacteriota bacterium]|nr:MAG: hypothetical protein D6800_12550 [candidate division Zixibacteria bacterium]